MSTNKNSDIITKFDNRSDSQTEDDTVQERCQLPTSEDHATFNILDTGNIVRLHRSISAPNLPVSCLQCTIQLPNNSNETIRTPNRTIQTASEHGTINVEQLHGSRDDFEINATANDKSYSESKPEQGEREEIHDGFMIFQLKVGPLTTMKEGVKVINFENGCNGGDANFHIRQSSLPNCSGNRKVAHKFINQMENISWTPVGVNNFSAENQKNDGITLASRNAKSTNSVHVCSEDIDDKENELPKEEIALHTNDGDSKSESDITSLIFEDHRDKTEDLCYNSNCSTGQCDDESCCPNHQQSNSCVCDCYSRCSSPAIPLVCRNPQHKSMHCHPKRPLLTKPPPHRILRPPDSPIHHGFPHLPPRYPHPHPHPHPHSHLRPCSHPHPHSHLQSFRHPHPLPHRHPHPHPHVLHSHPRPHPQVDPYGCLYSQGRSSPVPCLRHNSSNVYTAHWTSPVDQAPHPHIIYPSYRSDCFSEHPDWCTSEQLNCMPPVYQTPYPSVCSPLISTSFPASYDGIYPPIRNREEMLPYRAVNRTLVNRNYQPSMEPIVRMIRYDATSQTIGLESDINIPVHNNNNLLASKISRYENEIAKNELILNRLQRQLNMEMNGAMY